MRHTVKSRHNIKLRHVVYANIVNDKIKDRLAKKIGVKLYVFWASSQYLWEIQIKEMFKNEKA